MAAGFEPFSIAQNMVSLDILFTDIFVEQKITPTGVATIYLYEVGTCPKTSINPRQESSARVVDSQKYSRDNLE